MEHDEIEIETTEAPRENRVARVIDAWFAETVGNRGIDTELHNHLFAAKDRLKVLLRESEA
jgi:hypothetical protein